MSAIDRLRNLLDAPHPDLAPIVKQSPPHHPLPESKWREHRYGNRDGREEGP